MALSYSCHLSFPVFSRSTTSVAMSTDNVFVDCRICFDFFINGSSLAVLKACSHFYHKHCIDTAFAKASSRCPICQNPDAQRLGYNIIPGNVDVTDNHTGSTSSATTNDVILHDRLSDANTKLRAAEYKLAGVQSQFEAEKASVKAEKKKVKTLNQKIREVEHAKETTELEIAHVRTALANARAKVKDYAAIQMLLDAPITFAYDKEHYENLNNQSLVHLVLQAKRDFEKLKNDYQKMVKNYEDDIYDRKQMNHNLRVELDAVQRDKEGLYQSFSRINDQLQEMEKKVEESQKETLVWKTKWKALARKNAKVSGGLQKEIYSSSDTVARAGSKPKSDNSTYPLQKKPRLLDEDKENDPYLRELAAKYTNPGSQKSVRKKYDLLQSVQQSAKAVQAMSRGNQPLGTIRFRSSSVLKGHISSLPK
eukprot:CFRG7100T1